MLINFHGSVQSSKFFSVKCFIRVLNFHGLNREIILKSEIFLIYGSLSQETGRVRPPLTRNQPMGKDHLTKLGLASFLGSPAPKHAYILYLKPINRLPTHDKWFESRLDPGNASADLFIACSLSKNVGYVYEYYCVQGSLGLAIQVQIKISRMA